VSTRVPLLALVHRDAEPVCSRPDKAGFLFGAVVRYVELMKRNPRRAYDSAGREMEPMPLANMREHGVRSIDATCESCNHEATINVDSLPDEMPIPDVALSSRAQPAALSGLWCGRTGGIDERQKRAAK
jgi:hypothetical protein